MLVLFLLLGQSFVHGQSAFPPAEMNSAKKFSIDLVQAITRGDAALIYNTFLSTIRVDSSKLGNAVRRYGSVLKTQTADTSIQQRSFISSPYGPIILTDISWIGTDSSEVIRLSFNFVVRGTQFRLTRLDFVSDLPELFAPDARKADSLNAVVVNLIRKEDINGIRAFCEPGAKLDTVLLKKTLSEYAAAMNTSGINYRSKGSNPMEVFPEYYRQMTYGVNNNWQSVSERNDDPHLIIYFRADGQKMFISQLSFSRGSDPERYVQFPGGVYETETIYPSGREIPPPPPPPPPR